MNSVWPDRQGRKAGHLQDRGGEGVSPSPQGEGAQKILHFLHQNHTSVMHSDTLLK